MVSIRRLAVKVLSRNDKAVEVGARNVSEGKRNNLFVGAFQERGQQAIKENRAQQRATSQRTNGTRQK